jgi:hypothetical protein
MDAGLRRFEDSSAPENTQSLKSTQLALCAVMMGAAERASTPVVLHQFSMLKGFRTEVDNRLEKNKDRFPPGLPVVTVARRLCIPDNRFQLNVLLLHAERIGGDVATKARQICSQLDKSQVRVVDWRAHTTAFDVPHRMEGIPIDVSKGVVTYELYGWPHNILIDESAQRGLVEELLQLITSTVAADNERGG